jgi:dehydrodolichyl diphosphate syntase complex subunit NUS1
MKHILPPVPRSSTPSPPPSLGRAASSKKKGRSQRKKPIRAALKHQIHVFVFAIIQTTFGIFIRLRKAYHAIIDRVFAILYYHHRTPDLIRKDIQKLGKLPEHLSVILQLNGDEDRTSSFENLVNDVGEVTAWSASAGIPVLSIYERTGKVVLWIAYNRILTSRRHP